MPAARILLVNDIPDHVSSYRRALAASGYDVVVALNATAALRSAAAAPPDCAVIDVRLPDMHGWDLCRQLKAGPAGNIPVVLLAADVTKRIAADSASVGCNAWLAHPTVADDLVRLVRHVLAQATAEPRSPEEATVARACPACEGHHVRATLRMALIQYFSCRDCGFAWRVDTQPA